LTSLSLSFLAVLILLTCRIDRNHVRFLLLASSPLQWSVLTLSLSVFSAPANRRTRFGTFLARYTECAFSSSSHCFALKLTSVRPLSFWRIILFYLLTGNYSSFLVYLQLVLIAFLDAVIIIGFDVSYLTDGLHDKTTSTSPFTLVFQAAGASAFSFSSIAPPYADFLSFPFPLLEEAGGSFMNAGAHSVFPLISTQLLTHFYLIASSHPQSVFPFPL
jgi:hypothetical protein